METGELTLIDYARYPFIKQASEYLKNRQPRIELEDFSSPNLKPIVKATQRIKLSAKPLKYVTPPRIMQGEEENELLSFPLALALAKAVGDPYLWRRLALYEAIVAKKRLETEPPWKIVKIATENFKWKLSFNNRAHPPFRLHFADYLKNASGFRDEEWKLVNQRLVGGYVQIAKDRVARLLEEEVKKLIQARIEEAPKVTAPEALKGVIEELKVFYAGIRRTLSREELGVVRFEAFPPCMASLYFDLSEGRDMPHIGRFTLTAFLINLGMDVEEIVKLYVSVTDFDEGMTKYQVEHIAGLLGGKTKYRPLNCERMKTHGLCLREEELCKQVRGPLVYYRLRLKQISKVGRRPEKT